jgi:hypothetical protein
MQPIFKLIAISMTAFMLSACEPDLTVLGNIDEKLLITKAQIHEMGFEKFEKNYLGKEVTITDLKPLGKGGGFNPAKGQCNISYDGTVYRDGEFDISNRISVKIYANHTPSYALKQFFSKGSYIEGELGYEDEIDLPMEVCKSCDWNPDDKSCFYKSPNIIITGKIIQMGYNERSDRIAMVIRPKGFAY